MKAKDLMIPLQEYLKPDTTLKEAVNTLMTAQREARYARRLWTLQIQKTAG